MASAYLSIVVPAYNEEKGIGKVIDEIKAVMSAAKRRYEIIVVDDGSSDKTGRVAGSKKGIRLLRHETNRGYGASLKTGIRHANGELVLITDADGTYPIKDIPRLLAHTAEYDMVVGARTAKDVSIPLYRRPAKWFLSKMANYLSGTRIPDLNSGFRVFRKDTALRFFNILPHGFSFTTTITLSCLSSGLDVKYVPISYAKRQGRSKIKPFRDGFNFILLMLKTVTYFNPLKVFLPASLLLAGSAVAVLFYSVFYLGQVMDITIILLFVASIQTAFLGLLADLVSKK